MSHRDRTVMAFTQLLFKLLREGNLTDREYGQRLVMACLYEPEGQR